MTFLLRNLYPFLKIRRFKPVKIPSLRTVLNKLVNLLHVTNLEIYIPF